MMKLSLTRPEKMLALFIAFTLCLLTARVIYTGQAAYMFYPWNLFLAIVPVCFSRRLRKGKPVNTGVIFLIAGWLAFFPNAPYIITDIFHFEKRAGVPQWYDLLLVLSAAWSGLMAGFISLNDVEEYLSKYSAKKWRPTVTALLLFAASAGIYLGRFLRMNSWNVVTRPGAVAHAGLSFALKPAEHIDAWGFCVACTVFLTLVYYSIKKPMGLQR